MKMIQSGYQGKPDALRDMGKKMLGQTMQSKGKLTSPPESMSSPGNDRLRKFAGGGSLVGNAAGMLTGRLAKKGLDMLPFGKNVLGTGASMGDMAEGAFRGIGSAVPYKKGGKVHKETKQQTDMHMPRHVKSKLPPNILLNDAMKKGGHTSVKKEECAYQKKHGKHKRGIGGSILGGMGAPLVRGIGNKGIKNIAGTGVGLGDVLGSMFSTGAGFLPFKKGGKVKDRYADGGGVPGIDYVAKKGGHMKDKKCHAKHEASETSYKEQREHAKKRSKKNGYLFGGALAGGLAGAAAKPFLQKIPVVGGLLGTAAPWIGGGLGSLLPFKKGGQPNSHKGKAMKKASGGTVYERQMVGERPSTKMPHNSYESEMRGMKPVRKAMASGGEARMAMGGSGKVRHKQATSAGMAIKPKRHR